MTAVVALDPGARWAGIVARRGPELLAAQVLDRDPLDRVELPGGPASLQRWLDHVLDAVADLSGSLGLAIGDVVTACEFVTPPHPHGGRRDAKARIITPGPLMETAAVMGAMLGRWPGTVLVPPAQHGSGPDGAYPAGIRRRTRGLGGPTDHARAAWDVAGGALWHLRIRGAAHDLR